MMASAQTQRQLPPCVDNSTVYFQKLNCVLRTKTIKLVSSWHKRRCVSSELNCLSVKPRDEGGDGWARGGRLLSPKLCGIPHRKQKYVGSIGDKIVMCAGMCICLSSVVFCVAQFTSVNACVCVHVCVERSAVSLAQRLVSRRLRSHLPTSVTVTASEAFDCTVTVNLFPLTACERLTVCDYGRFNFPSGCTVCFNCCFILVIQLVKY